MITQQQMQPLLVEACPSFEAVWSAMDPEFQEIQFSWYGEFVHHLLELYLKGDLESFPAVGAVIERFHLEGDEYVRQAATIGILEGIQNYWGNQDVNPEVFTAFLQPESMLWWEQLNLFWSSEIPYVGASFPKRPDSASST